MLAALSEWGAYSMKEQRDNDTVYAIGLISGTSVDGIDAALISITGDDEKPAVRLQAYCQSEFDADTRSAILSLCDAEEASAADMARMNFLLGEMFAEAAISVIKKAGLKNGDISVIGSHGQTVFHQPESKRYLGRSISCTLQIGEGAVIAERTGIPTVSDFRVADMAAGGQGAPLVPYSEYILYRKLRLSRLLQNIGGIGNMTALKAGCSQDEVIAFDTGPGNMLIDAAASYVTRGRLQYDKDGILAKAGRVNNALLSMLQIDPYYSKPLPKSCGREQFGAQCFSRTLSLARRLDVMDNELVPTLTELTAWSIADAYHRYIRPSFKADELIVGGGGSLNPALMEAITRQFEKYYVRVMTQKEIGFDPNAKEAIAFAIMADRAMKGMPNVLPSGTGAGHASILGNLSMPDEAEGRWSR